MSCYYVNKAKTERFLTSRFTLNTLFYYAETPEKKVEKVSPEPKKGKAIMALVNHKSGYNVSG